MSLQLDSRQRAMLQEMGVRVFGSALPLGLIDDAPPGPPRGGEAAAAAARDAGLAGLRPAPAPYISTAQNHSARALASDVATMDWPALQSAVASCEACGLCQNRKNTVFGMGDTQARWLVVGEAPGESEDLQGLPFVGAAGQLLDNMLKAIGLDRHAKGEKGVFIANVLKCRPPANRNPLPEEIAQCAPYLQRQLELMQPKIILALGRFAAQALLQASVPDVAQIPLGKLRGQTYRFQDVPVIVSYHPAYLLRTPQDKAKAWADLCLALEVSRQR